MPIRVPDNATDEDLTMAVSLGHACENVARLPNCIFRITPEAITTVLDVANAPGAVWGDVFPRCTPSGPDVWDGEWPLLESFPRWADPENQQELPELKGMRGQERFHMLIDARTPLDVLKRTYDESIYIADLMGNWDDELADACRWIEDLGWCCIFLDWAELGHALFIAAHGNGQLADRLSAGLRKKGKEVASARLTGGKATWTGPTVL